MCDFVWIATLCSAGLDSSQIERHQLHHAIHGLVQMLSLNSYCSFSHNKSATLVERLFGRKEKNELKVITYIICFLQP